MEVTAKCPKCHNWQVFTPPPDACPKCGGALMAHRTEAFDQCPVCGAAHLYRQKDFNRKLGVGLVVIGVILAYWTYGLSLLAVTLIDWLLVRRVGQVGC